MLYAYTKDPDFCPKVFSPNHDRIIGLFSFLFLSLGLALVGQVVYPIVSWYAFLLPTYSGSFVSPLTSVAPVRAADVITAMPSYLNSNSYKPSSWFPDAKPFTPTINSNLQAYTISIPKLKIDNATVEIGGDDLKKALIAWPTSAVPGNYGVNIIFGHSELPQFANTKDYSGIFTFIMDLKDGDVIYVDYDGVRYKYVVFDRQVVEPDNLSVLEQRFDDRYLSLITCVPPGTLWKRGVVKAKLSTL